MWVKVGGILLFENQELEVNWPDVDTDVETVLGGSVGVSPGPDKMMLTASNAVKAAGTDINLSEAKKNRTELPVEIGRIGNPSTINATMLVRSVRFSSGTGQQTVENLEMSALAPIPAQPDGW
jgi:hypothetical protein